MPDEYVKDHVIIYTRILRQINENQKLHQFLTFRNINLQNLRRASAFIDVMDRKVDQVKMKKKLQRLIYLFRKPRIS